MRLRSACLLCKIRPEIGPALRVLVQVLGATSGEAKRAVHRAKKVLRDCEGSTPQRVRLQGVLLATLPGNALDELEQKCKGCV